MTRPCWSSGCTVGPATSRPTTQAARPHRVPRTLQAHRHTVPGLQLSELLPRHARVAHRFTLLRSLAHTGPCHDSGPQQLFTGFPITVNRPKPDHPDLFAIVDRLRADPSRALPNNVGVPPIPYLGAAYLGPAHEPFAVHGDPNDPQFEVPNIGFEGERTAPPRRANAPPAAAGRSEPAGRTAGATGGIRRLPAAGLERADWPGGPDGHST